MIKDTLLNVRQYLFTVNYRHDLFISDSQQDLFIPDDRHDLFISDSQQDLFIFDHKICSHLVISWIYLYLLLTKSICI